MRYAIDAPTLLRIVAEELPVDATHQIVAPNRIRSQALQLLLDRVRSGGMTEADALAQHERMTALKMRLLGDRVSRRVAWKLARDHDWPTIDDAEYLAVASLQADALITADGRLAELADGIVVRLAELAELLE